MLKWTWTFCLIVFVQFLTILMQKIKVTQNNLEKIKDFWELKGVKPPKSKGSEDKQSCDSWLINWQMINDLLVDLSIKTLFGNGFNKCNQNSLINSLGFSVTKKKWYLKTWSTCFHCSDHQWSQKVINRFIYYKNNCLLQSKDKDKEDISNMIKTWGNLYPNMVKKWRWPGACG